MATSPGLEPALNTGGLREQLALLSWTLFYVCIASMVLYYPGWIIYTLFFHPLSRYPGPKLAAITPFVHLMWDVQGKQHEKMKELHDKYGDVVRFSPNSLCYRTAPAWREIYGHRTMGRGIFVKDPSLYPLAPNGVNTIIAANGDDHTRMRRLLAHAFSRRALSEQESILHIYADLLLDRLGGMIGASSSTTIDMSLWFNFTTFDLIGALAFGEPFDCLMNSQYHWWVSLLQDAVKGSTYLKVFYFYPIFSPLLALLVPKDLIQKRQDSFDLSVEKTRRRLKSDTTRPDFISYIIKHSKDGSGLTEGEIDANSAVFVLAGSETTAALLSGCVYHLLQDQNKYRRLVQEIRGAFTKAADIKLADIADLPYLNAVLTESLRIYPPVPALLPRLVPEGGAMINERFVPAGVSVAVSLYSAFHAATNFTNPESFVPERWLTGPESAPYASDIKEALQPFSYGAQNCLGRHLAYAEMRLILTKLLWHYDLEFLPESSQWLTQKSYTLWERPPLMVKLMRIGVKT